MLLTITYRGPNAMDLGYLLHKNPSRPQSIELNHGVAHVFYPEATDASCTAALLLDINPIDLARGKEGKGGLFDYVNDRPYVASSFLSVAISRVFGTAMSGRCQQRPALAEMLLKLSTTVTMLPCTGGEEILRGLFEPLGYAVQVEGYPLDTAFPDWGPSRYFSLTLEGEVRLCDLLTHLYVLIPALDAQKHYWVGQDELEKLLRHGEGWLSSHPMKEYIVSRYLKRKKRIIYEALSKLHDAIPEEEQGEESEDEEALTEAQPERTPNLNDQRLQSVIAALKNSGARSVLDAGCGEGKLLSLLIKERSFVKIAGMDVSFTALERAKERLHIDRMGDQQKERVELFQGSLTYRDKRLEGYDACTVVEVIEHMDANRLSTFEKVLFQHARPMTVVLTTPNREYNENYRALNAHALRHGDHRFEWTRAEFRAWAFQVTERYGYTVQYADIGDIDPVLGSPTQMGVFSR